MRGLAVQKKTKQNHQRMRYLLNFGGGKCHSPGNYTFIHFPLHVTIDVSESKNWLLTWIGSKQTCQEKCKTSPGSHQESTLIKGYIYTCIYMTSVSVSIHISIYLYIIIYLICIFDLKVYPTYVRYVTGQWSHIFRFPDYCRDGWVQLKSIKFWGHSILLREK